MMKRVRPSWLFARLAVQDLHRQPVRVVLLVLAVSVASGAALGSTLLRRSLDQSLSTALDRLGADAMVLPRATRANLTAALLTVEPTDQVIDEATAHEVAGLPGVAVAAPQQFIALPTAEGHGEDGLIVFDPARDFTVLPWLEQKLDRPLRRGDVIIGGRRPETVGGVAPLFGRTFPVYGKLALTGVGPFERSYFVTAETAEDIAAAAERQLGRPLFTPSLSRPSAVLVQLAPGATPERFRFSAARLPELQVVAGNGLVTSVRHAVATLLRGSLVFSLLLLVTTTILVAALYTGLLAERPHELGLLLAVGMRPGQVLRLLLAEAALTTGLGGVCGVLLGAGGLVAFRRSIGFIFERSRIPFELAGWQEIAIAGAASTLVCCAVGAIGALLPAWRASRREPYMLVRTEAA